MVERTQKGATLAFASASIVILCILGVGLLALMFLLGGSRQLDGATDSGCLNVAKQLIKHPQVALKQGKESILFEPFTDDSGQVNVDSYNKIEAAALLIGANAVEMRHEDPFNERPMRGATDVANTVNGNDGIGRRLADAVNKNKHADADFMGAANANSIRMLQHLGKKSQIDKNSIAYSTAWLGKDDACNVTFDPKLYPGLGTSHTTTVDGKQYLKGYHPIKLASNLEYNFISLYPGSQPHLVSNVTYSKDSLKLTNVPANTVHTQGRVHSTQGMVFDLALSSSAVTAPVQADFKPSLPSGYLVIYNPGSSGTADRVPFVRNIFTTQLADEQGVYVGIDVAGQPVAFSTNKDVFGAWTDYNSGAGSNANGSATGNDGTTSEPPAPPAIPLSGDDQVFDPKGHPLSSAMSPESVMARVKSSKKLIWSDDQTPLYEQLLEGMRTAYPQSVSNLPSGGGGLIALEQYKLELMQLFMRVGEPFHDDNISWPIAVPQPSGLKLFDHDRAYLNECPFSRNGSPYDLMQQILNPHPNYAAENARTDAMANALAARAWAKAYRRGFRMPSVVLQDRGINLQPDQRTMEFQKKLYDRIRQIKPEATDAEIKSCLQSQSLPLNTVLYVYMRDPKQGRTLVLSQAAPPALKLSGTQPVTSLADGKQQPAYAITYNSHRRAINTIGDAGGWPVTFAKTPEPSAIHGKDSMLWTPGSGSNGCLGMLKFQNEVAPSLTPGTPTMWGTPN